MNKILVVDDERSVIKLMENVFRKQGYETRSAESAEEALSLLENEKIHVMFLDLNLPGMNGVELCREIRKQMPMALIYAITGYASLFELSDCREAGFDDYFKKPVQINTLIKTAEDAFKTLNRWKRN
ncbi:MAG: response regulator [Thermodesulfobacteriota bacterium]